MVKDAEITCEVKEGYKHEIKHSGIEGTITVLDTNPQVMITVEGFYSYSVMTREQLLSMLELVTYAESYADKLNTTANRRSAVEALHGS